MTNGGDWLSIPNHARSTGVMLRRNLLIRFASLP
jgi:hypothetical protein